MTDTALPPLERAARAMYANVQPDWDWNDPDAEPMRQLYRDNVRVAIMAVMDPSAGMVARGERKLAGGAALDVWQAMVAAMLQGE